MDDEKMLRAALAGHALQGFLSNRWRDMPHETSKAQIAAEAVRWADALLVELKKDSPAPAEDCPPPGLTVPAGAGEVVPEEHFSHRCEAFDCSEPGELSFEYVKGRRAHFCKIHRWVEESILREWHRAFLKARAA